MARNSASRVPAKPASGSTELKTIRCAIYTRKSTEEGLQQEFNSLDAQRESAEAFILSQKNEGWQVITEHFDDGGYTGGNMDRAALKRLLAAVEARTVDCIVVYKVDRLSRALLDFSRIIEVFDRHGVSFVAVTQQFNTTSSLDRLTLNILLSFAQFEREIISERTRDKMSAARRKGKWSERRGRQECCAWTAGPTVQSQTCRTTGEESMDEKLPANQFGKNGSVRHQAAIRTPGR